jgi:parallel beta-helix repeat protein
MIHVIRRFRVALSIGFAVVVVAAVVGVFAFSVHHANAQNSTRFVGTSIGTNSGCSSPGYTSVQAAVNAATNGQTVYLCGAHTYTGTVIIANKQLTLTGDPGATIAAPATFTPLTSAQLPPQFAKDNLFAPNVVLFIWGASAKVSVTHLIVTGVMPTNNSCADEEYGVLVLDGASATLDQDQVLNIHDSNNTLYGCQFGVAIEVGSWYWPTEVDNTFGAFLAVAFTGHANITNTLVQGYQKNGITYDGTGATGDMHSNTVNGSGRDHFFAPIIAQNGIQISDGAYVTIERNTISDNTYTGPAFASSTGILVFGGCGGPLVTNTTVFDNVTYENDIGIALVNYNTTCTGPPTAQTSDLIIDNELHNTHITNVGAWTFGTTSYQGYQAGIDVVGNSDSITSNYIYGLGYTKREIAGTCFILPIDTITFPTIDSSVFNNHPNRFSPIH